MLFGSAGLSPEHCSTCPAQSDNRRQRGRKGEVVALSRATRLLPETFITSRAEPGSRPTDRRPPTADRRASHHGETRTNAAGPFARRRAGYVAANATPTLRKVKTMTTHEATGTRGFRAPVQVAALAVGVVFLLVGIAGFIPGLTTDLDMLAWAGHHSGSQLFGLFAVSVLHNLVHLAFGVVGVLAARHFRHSRAYLIGGGVVYAVLWLYGLVINRDTALNFVPLNNADNWLHLGLAIGMIALGALLGRYAIHTGTGAMGTSASARSSIASTDQ
jgi:uncharacterized protein DUF4383